MRAHKIAIGAYAFVGGLLPSVNAASNAASSFTEKQLNKLMKRVGATPRQDVSLFAAVNDGKGSKYTLEWKYATKWRVQLSENKTRILPNIANKAFEDALKEHFDINPLDMRMNTQWLNNHQDMKLSHVADYGYNDHGYFHFLFKLHPKEKTFYSIGSGCWYDDNNGWEPKLVMKMMTDEKSLSEKNLKYLSQERFIRGVHQAKTSLSNGSFPKGWSRMSKPAAPKSMNDRQIDYKLMKKMLKTLKVPEQTSIHMETKIGYDKVFLDLKYKIWHHNGRGDWIALTQKGCEAFEKFRKKHEAKRAKALEETDPQDVMHCRIAWPSYITQYGYKEGRQFYHFAVRRDHDGTYYTAPTWFTKPVKDDEEDDVEWQKKRKELRAQPGDFKDTWARMELRERQ